MNNKNNNWIMCKCGAAPDNKCIYKGYDNLVKMTQFV